MKMICISTKYFTENLLSFDLLQNEIYYPKLIHHLKKLLQIKHKIDSQLPHFD